MTNQSTPQKVSSSRLKRLAKEGGWVVIGQFVAVAGSLVLVRVLTEILEPIHYGELALGLTAASLVNQVVLGGIAAGVARFYVIAKEKHDLDGYLNSAWCILIYATMAVVIIGIILSVALSWAGYSRWLGLSTVVLMFAVVTGYNSTLSGIQNAARQRAIVAFHGGLNAWLKILIVITVVVWIGASATVVVIGYLCSSLLITMSQLFFLRRTIPRTHTSPESRLQWIPSIWAYSLPFSTFGVFTWMQQISDRWALQAFASTSDVGHYAVLFQLGFAPIALVTGMAVNLFGPILYQWSGDATNHSKNSNVHRFAWRMAFYSLGVTFLGFMASFVLHDLLFTFLVASEYREVSYLLPWVVLAGGVFATGQLLALKLMSDMKPSTMTKPKIVTALVGVLSNVLGAAIAGVQGVVGGMLIFSCIYFFWMAMLSRRLKHEETRR